MSFQELRIFDCIPFLKAMEAVDRFIAAVMRCRTDQRKPIFGTDGNLNKNSRID